MFHPAMPPFGKGFDGEDLVWTSEAVCPRTNGLVDRFVAISHGPLYTDDDIADIIHAVDKVCKAMF